MFHRRSGGTTELLEWRVRLFGAGAIIAVVGMYHEASWMVWIAVAVLAAGLVVRHLPGARGEGEESDDRA